MGPPPQDQAPPSGPGRAQVSGARLAPCTGPPRREGRPTCGLRSLCQILDRMAPSTKSRKGREGKGGGNGGRVGGRRVESKEEEATSGWVLPSAEVTGRGGNHSSPSSRAWGTHTDLRAQGSGEEEYPHLFPTGRPLP